MVHVENGEVVRYYMAAVRNFNVYVGEVRVLRIWGDTAELASASTYSGWSENVKTDRLHRTKQSALKAAIPDMRLALETLGFLTNKLQADIANAERIET